MSDRWTLDELVAEAATRLGGIEQESNRVRDVPDQRTVRYYTTLGLVDGPTEMRGKVGLYGEKQLLQILAIKRLQARGETLATIQSKLIGLPASRLRAIADVDAASTAVQSPAAPLPRGVMQGVSVSNSVIVMLRSKRDLTAEDLEAIEAATAPLLKLLRARNLVEDK